MRVGIVGAGSIGTYLAAELASGGADVVLVARSCQGRQARQPVAVRVDGRELSPRRPVVVTDDYGALRDADVVIVAVKSRDTEAVAARLEPCLAAESAVVSFQNGLANAARLRHKLGRRVAAGAVTYNVFIDADGRARQATSGKLLVERLSGEAGRHLSTLRDAFRASGSVVELRDDIEAILAGKLLINLNNGVCAATGLGIAAALRDGDARWCFSRCMREGLGVMRAAGLRPARVTVLPPSLLSAALRLPDAVVVRLARGIASVHPDARSSTLQDLDRGRPTEVGDLNGAIVSMAERVGLRAPANEVIADIVHGYEDAVLAGAKPAFVSPRELRERIERASHGFA